MIGLLALSLGALAMTGGNNSPQGGKDSPGAIAAQIPSRVKLSDAQVKKIGLVTKLAQEETVSLSIRRPGEVVANGDKLAEVSPGVGGVIRKLHVNKGDKIEADAALATLESAELAAVQAAYFNANDQQKLAQVSFDREKRLWEQKITSEESYLAARRVLQEAEITQRTAAQALNSLGVKPGTGASVQVGTYTLRSPISGTIISRNAIVGQVISADAAMFVITDLAKVWVEVRLYPDDLDRVSLGEGATIYSNSNSENILGSVSQTVPNFDEKTRTAIAIVEVDTSDAKLSPGQFVEVDLPIKKTQFALVVPEKALVRYGQGKWQVFIETEKNVFDPIEVSITGKIATGVLISGVPNGSKLVTDGAFFLRAELDKGSLVDND